MSALYRALFRRRHPGRRTLSRNASAPCSSISRPANVVATSATHRTISTFMSGTGHPALRISAAGGLPADAGQARLQPEDAAATRHDVLDRGTVGDRGRGVRRRRTCAELRPGARCPTGPISRNSNATARWRRRSSQSQSARHRGEDRGAPERRSALRQGRDRRSRLHQSRCGRCGARDASHGDDATLGAPKPARAKRS